MRCMIAASLEMSDEPYIVQLFGFTSLTTAKGGKEVWMSIPIRMRLRFG